MNYPEEIIDSVAWFICPRCYEEKCVGKVNCRRIMNQLDEHMREDSFKEIAERRVTDAEE